MNILHIIHYANFGGPHNQTLMLREHLLPEGFETIVVLPDEYGNAYPRLVAGNVEVLKICLHRARASFNLLDHANFLFYFFPEIKEIRNIIREKKIGLVLIGGLVNPHAAFAAAMERVPVVWQILDTRTPSILRWLLSPLVRFFSSATMCTGAKVARLHRGMASRKGLHLYVPPVDPLRFKPDPEKRKRARLRLNVDNDDFLIGTVGNITPQKGHEYLIEAAKMIQASIPNSCFRILGSIVPSHMPYQKTVYAMASKVDRSRPGAFAIIDPEDKVADLLPAFDLFVLSSVPRSEGIPTVILEAMACAVPVIATDVGAVEEVIADDKTGIIVPQKNPKAISDAVIHLYKDKRRRRQLGLAARIKVLEHFTIEHCTRSHVQAFEFAISHYRKKPSTP